MRRSKTDKILGGVCGGIGKSLGVEPWIIRIIWIFLSFGTYGFPGGLVYILFWLFMPEE